MAFASQGQGHIGGQTEDAKFTSYFVIGQPPSHPASVEDTLFDLFAEHDGKVNVDKFWRAINLTGIQTTDTRLRKTRENFTRVQLDAASNLDNTGTHRVDRKTFKECTADDIFILSKTLTGLVIPEFSSFTEEIGRIYTICKANRNGKLATYIPQLARASPESFGLAICTIDCQRRSYGDCDVPFCLQSCGKPLNYALAVSDIGADKVHQYVGQEPSGRTFDELSLNQQNMPHNPMINSGAIVINSLLQPKLSMADRFDHVFNQYKRMAGGEYIGFSNATFLSERENADRNYALGYYMRENKCFPEDTDLMKTMEFYCQLCSVEVTAESASVIAATLANGGICPTTGERVLAGDAVRNTLSLMHSCGMYDYSGQFAFKVGLPAKSGVAGAILLVVPNVMGICTWSPPLDEMGNSCRGIQFCEELVSRFNFHNYDDLNHSLKKRDPRKRKIDIEANAVRNILFGATNGDATAIRRFAMTGENMGVADCDGRTALHLACAEGHLHVVRLLLEQCQVTSDPKDRWGFTPVDDAERFGHEAIVDYLLDYEGKLRAGRPPRMTRRQSDFFDL